MAKKRRGVQQKAKAQAAGKAQSEPSDADIVPPPVKKSRRVAARNNKIPDPPPMKDDVEELEVKEGEEIVDMKQEVVESNVEIVIEEPEQPVPSVKTSDVEDVKSDKLTEEGGSDDSDGSDTSSDSDSTSDSDSDSSDSDSKSNATKEEVAAGELAVAAPVNSVTNNFPVKPYTAAARSSSSDSYHSDTEEEDKRRRKKQKRIQKLQMNKKLRRSGSGSGSGRLELGDEDEEGGDPAAANADAEMPDWPVADFGELLRRIEAQLPLKDNLKFDSRAAKLDWSRVRFKEYTAEECYDVWVRMSKRIRRFRTLNEMLCDARAWITKPWTNFYRGPKKNRHPDMPARPLSTYMIYYLEHKDRVASENPGMEMTQVSKIISEAYKNLSAEEKDKLAGMAAQERANFEEKLSEFYKDHPEMVPQPPVRPSAREAAKGPKKPCAPFKLFCQEQMKLCPNGSASDRKTVEDDAKEKWRAMSDKKKLVWINWALEDLKRYEDELKTYQQEHPDFVLPVGTKSVLNKDERCIKERLAGKPVKPPNSAYSLFSRVMLQSDEDVKRIPPKLRMAEISRKWKDISDAQKQRYEENVRELQEQYKLEFASYLEGLTGEEREEELKKSMPKRRGGGGAAVSTVVSKPQPPPELRRTKRSIRGSSATSAPVLPKPVLHLYKNEPPPPPVRAYDLFLQVFMKERPAGTTEAQRMKEAPRYWEILAESRKEVHRKNLRELKQKYISDYEIFLKGLSPDELKEFSVLKAKAKRIEEQEEQMGRSNGTLSDSNEDSDSDKNGTSSDESSSAEGHSSSSSCSD